MWPWNLMNELKAPLLHKALCISSNPLVNSNLSPEILDSGKNWRIFVPRDPEIWWMTLKNNRAPLLNYIKFCAAFQSHWYIQTCVTVQKRSIGANWKTIGHLSYAASSFKHHFIAIGAFKLESQSGNAQYSSKSAKFLAMWPWNLMDDLEKQ